MITGLDNESYDIIWDKLILPELKQYVKKFEPYIYFSQAAKDEIWKQYVFLNTKLKNQYMQDSSKILDRHKVAACYMVAICNVKPLRFNKPSIAKPNNYFIANELVAISVATTLVVNFVIAATKNSSALTETQKQEIYDKFKDGICFPEKEITNHGEYITNYAMELYLSNIKSDFNLLSIAHELYLLEALTMVRTYTAKT